MSVDPTRVYPDGIDPDMKRLQWLNWAIETNGKVPKQPHTPGKNAKSNDVTTWGGFDDARATAKGRDLGVGISLAQPSPFVAIDIDIPNGGGWVPEFDRLGGAVVERSPSGNRRVYLRDVDVPEWWTNQGENGPDTREVKLFDDAGYVTVTGDVLDGHEPPIDETSQVAFETWLKEGWRAFADEDDREPWGPSEDERDGSRDAESGQSGDLSADDVRDALDHIDPDLPYDDWRDVGFALQDEFGDATAERLFKEWSRRGSKWDREAERIAKRIIEDADPGNGRTIGTVIYHAKNGGWSRPGRTTDSDDTGARADSDGGTTTTSATAEDVPDSDEQEGPWDAIRREYALAEDADDRKPARFKATTQLREERYWANIEGNDVLYGYDPETGVYEDRGESIVRNTLGEHLGEQFGGHELREILLQLRAFETVREREMGGPAGHIPAENGVLSVGGGEPELLPHDPEYRFLASLSTEYDADAECPRFMQFLDEVVSTEMARLKLQEYAGYTLMHWGLPHHKALFLVGPTASGKSTFLDTIRGMHGERTVSSLAPQQMTQRFGGADLYGKWANFRNDIPAAMIKNTGTFKEIVAGDRIKAEEKFKDPFHFSPTAKHLFSANQLPETETDDEAFYRRILLVPFPTSIPRGERDTHLDDKLQQELPGVLNWALEGLNRLTTQGKFTGDRAPGETQNTWEKWGKSIDRFRRVGLTDSVDESVPKSRVYQAYVRFCQDENIPAETQHAMTRKLKTEGIEDGREYIDGKQERVFFGVCLSDRGQALLAEKGSATQSESSSDLPNDLRDY